MDLGIRGRSYAVVGGSRGIGWATAQTLAAEGGNVAILCRNPDQVAAKGAILGEANGVQVIARRADVTVPGSAEAAIESAIAALGSIYGLAVTNYSLSRTPPPIEMSDAEWDHMYQDVLMGSVRCCRAIVPHMAAGGGGAIVLTSAYSARAPRSYTAGYSAMKAAIIPLCKSLAKAHGPQGIRVNCIAPGYIKTERYAERRATLRAAQPDLSDREADRMMVAKAEMTTALERPGDAREVADMVAFLLSDRSGYTTGLVANVDGGTDF